MSVTPNFIFWTVWFLSFIGYFLFIYIYGLFPSLDWYNIAPLALNHPVYWLAVVVVPMVLVVSDYMVEIFWEQVDPSSRDLLVRKIREAEKLEGKESDEARNSTASGHSGIALSTCFSSGGSNAGHRETPSSSAVGNPMNAESKI
eukprot:gene43780-53540_t